MIVLGIDPGLVNTGWGIVVERGRYEVEAYGCIKTDSKFSLPERLVVIYQGLEKVIEKYKPDTMAVEKIFFAKNMNSTLLLGHARGIILLAGKQSGLSISEYTALQVKQALTGYGRAEKRQIQDMLKALLGLSKIPKPNDAADAIAVAICHLSSNKYISKINSDKN